jgi:hypothetical protein
VNDAGPLVVGPTGVAVAVLPGADRVEVGTVPLPAGTEAPPLGAVRVEIKVVGAVPEEQGTVIVVYDITDAVVLAVTDEAAEELALTEETALVETVVVGVQFGKVKVPL